MYLLGHTGFTALIGFFSEKFFNKKELDLRINYIILLFGSMLPDMVDKPIGSLIFSNGRWIGHSIIFILFVSILVYFFAYYFHLDHKSITFSILLGCLMHLVLDQPGLDIDVILWPFFGFYLEGGNWNGFLFGIENPYVWITETLGLIALINIGFLKVDDKRYWFLGFVLVVGYLMTYIILYYYWVLNL